MRVHHGCDTLTRTDLTDSCVWVPGGSTGSNTYFWQMVWIFVYDNFTLLSGPCTNWVLWSWPGRVQPLSVQWERGWGGSPLRVRVCQLETNSQGPRQGPGQYYHMFVGRMKQIILSQTVEDKLSSPALYLATFSRWLIPQTFLPHILPLPGDCNQPGPPAPPLWLLSPSWSGCFFRCQLSWPSISVYINGKYCISANISL